MADSFVSHHLRSMLGLPAKVIVLLFVCAGMVGCTHSMEVLNLEDYVVISETGQPMDIAISPFEGDDDAMVYMRAIVEALRAHPATRTIQPNWTGLVNLVGFNPSHTITLQVTPQYKGSGNNFLITWPGSYIFACAWHGFEYEASVNTVVDITPTVDAQSMASDAGIDVPVLSRSIKTDFEMRHCDFERGFWSSSSWWVPGYGVHNIVTGLIFIQYETDATKPFHDVVDPVYSRYVANEIVKLLQQNGGDAHARGVMQASAAQYK